MKNINRELSDKIHHRFFVYFQNSDIRNIHICNYFRNFIKTRILGNGNTIVVLQEYVNYNTGTYF